MIFSPAKQLEIHNVLHPSENNEFSLTESAEQLKPPGSSVRWPAINCRNISRMVQHSRDHNPILIREVK
jgi:hypothetical protein